MNTQDPDDARSSHLTDHSKANNPVFPPSETFAPHSVNMAPPETVALFPVSLFPPPVPLASRGSASGECVPSFNATAVSMSCIVSPTSSESGSASSAPYSPASCSPGTASSECSCSYNDSGRSFRTLHTTSFTPLNSTSCAVSISPSTAIVCFSLQYAGLLPLLLGTTTQPLSHIWLIQCCIIHPGHLNEQYK